MARRQSLWSYTIAGWSGFYVMLVELLSGRLIAPSFGSSIYVWGSVIFVFMLGLAIGYLFGGMFSRYSPSVVRLCGILFASDRSEPGLDRRRPATRIHALARGPPSHCQRAATGVPV